jgi:hypothetical protein
LIPNTLFAFDLTARLISFALFAVFALASGAGGLFVVRDLRAKRTEGGLPILLGCGLGFGLGVAFVVGVSMVLLALFEHRHRHVGNEVAAIGALKTIGSAQALFREADKEGDGNLDYGTLFELGEAGTSGLIDSVLASGTKQGYYFQAGYGLQTSEFLWFATAEPAIPGTTGDRYFATNQEGVIFYTTSGPFRFNLDDCGIPSEAIPVGR